MPRVRMIFSKTGPASFISHIDLPIIFGRAVRRAGLGPEMTQGFSPHQRIALGPPLPVGVEGLQEPSDMWTLKWRDDSEAALREAMPRGIYVIGARVIPDGRSLSKLIVSAEYEIRFAVGVSVRPASSAIAEMLEEAEAGSCQEEGETLRVTVERELERCGPSRMVARMIESGAIDGWRSVMIKRTNVKVADDRS